MSKLCENSTPLYTVSMGILRIWEGAEGSGINASQAPVFVTVLSRELCKLSHTAFVNLQRRILPNPSARLQRTHSTLLMLL